jgi:hypothetical protein
LRNKEKPGKRLPGTIGSAALGRRAKELKQEEELLEDMCRLAHTKCI